MNVFGLKYTVILKYDPFETPMNSINKVETPCIGVCSTGIGDSVCRGCKRYVHEIIDWNIYTSKQRRAVTVRLQDLLSQVVSAKVEVTDRERLLTHLRRQQIDHNENQSSQVLIYALLRVGASQIKDARRFGFTVNQQYKDDSLVSFKRQIDDDFYTLSCAYYERFIEPRHLVKAE